MGISSAPYHEILERLSRHHTLIAPDLPSFARSPYGELISDYDDYASLMLSFLDALNLKQVHVVGHSLGGEIAITLATLAQIGSKAWCWQIAREFQWFLCWRLR
ncbi:alpha/beta fold hydrolase [Oscillatoria sp. FACHB-1407]|uniref:alpha/beta fold hydrolase n=1 Tax=Oscillatoria sp. FACHB-1407 TaxID=2692847 RepID=UPI0028167F39|nr:alpha/beta fold hydrolase [Oscillatoria sp. FACHB-1407]